MHAAFPSLPVPKPVKLTLIYIRKARTKSVQIPATSPRNGIALNRGEIASDMS